MIIKRTYELLKKRYGDEFNKLVISDVIIGVYLTAVRLSDNSTGTASTLVENKIVCAKGNRDFGDFTPLRIKGRKVADILETDKITGMISSLKTAVLSALSSRVILAGGYNIMENLDPIQLINHDSSRTITIVGAFQSYIRKIRETGNRLYVLELDENALDEDQREFFVPANDYKKIFPLSDTVIITGQTLVNRKIDDLLAAISPGTQVIVTGPSSNILPDVLFENNVSIIGASRITDPDMLFRVISEGGTGFHIFEYCARKICILRNEIQVK
jgi:uncharacterized protein